MYNTHNDVFESLKLYFPSTAADVVHWYPSGRYEITMILNDRARFIFNSVTRTLRQVPKPDDGSEVISESRWRKEFSTRLYNIMRDKGITQSELAERVGTSQVTISNYMRGRATPTTYNLASISRVLNCSIAELIDFEY